MAEAVSEATKLELKACQKELSAHDLMRHLARISYEFELGNDPKKQARLIKKASREASEGNYIPAEAIMKRLPPEEQKHLKKLLAQATQKARKGEK